MTFSPNRLGETRVGISAAEAQLCVLPPGALTKLSRHTNTKLAITGAVNIAYFTSNNTSQL